MDGVQTALNTEHFEQVSHLLSWLLEFNLCIVSRGDSTNYDLC